jgi:hypothetical protein
VATPPPSQSRLLQRLADSETIRCNHSAANQPCVSKWAGQVLCKTESSGDGNGSASTPGSLAFIVALSSLQSSMLP